jgi:AhpD family alkylhydroperoxidase
MQDKAVLTERLNIKALEPDAYKAMHVLEAYLKNCDISPVHRELVKIRASQINGCAYCIQLHAGDARKLGETEHRIYALSAWKESPLFSDEERALLALTEEVTLIAGHGVSDETYNNMLQYFDEKTIAQIIMLIITINAWNRIAVATHLVHK